MKLKAWVLSKNWKAHSLAVTGVTLACIITQDQQVRDFVLTVFKNHPSLGTDLVILAGIIAKYSHSSSAAGQVAAAEVILASPKAPNEIAIAAAQTSTQPEVKPVTGEK